MRTLVKNILKQWLTLIIAITCIYFTIYVVIQQDIRIGAYDPQIQLAEDTAKNLNNYIQPVYLPKIDIAQSLGILMIIYDGQGHIESSNGTLNGELPQIPFGVLTMAKQKGENRLT